MFKLAKDWVSQLNSSTSFSGSARLLLLFQESQVAELPLGKEAFSQLGYLPLQPAMDAEVVFVPFATSQHEIQLQQPGEGLLHFPEGHRLPRRTSASFRKRSVSPSVSTGKRYIWRHVTSRPSHGGTKRPAPPCPLRPHYETGRLSQFERSKPVKCSNWLGMRDSNPRIPGSKPGALPLGQSPSRHFRRPAE
jgi:hypothetical protein